MSRKLIMSTCLCGERERRCTARWFENCEWRQNWCLTWVRWCFWHCNICFGEHSRIATYRLRKCSSFVLFNLVVVIEGALVRMDGDLYDLVSWLSGFLQFGQIFRSNDWRSAFPLGFILDLAYQTSGFRRWIMAKYRGPEVRISKGRQLRNFLKSLTGPLRPPSVAHISCSGFWCVTVKLPVRIFSFLLPQAGSRQPQCPICT